MREGQTFSGSSLLARYASFVKLPHTLFALPFAGVGVVLGSYVSPAGVHLRSALWILVAFTAARFAAMGFNRVADRRYDALNPRTRLRELPTGRLGVGQAMAAVAAASLLFVIAAWQLNPLCGWLSFPALVWLFGYSYTKRFTVWSHNVLGAALGMAPVGGYLAVTGEWAEPWYALLVLAAAVMFWVAGFDLIYSLQDVEFDRGQGLFSLPARRGPKAALRAARAFHLAAVGCFSLLWAFAWFPVGRWYVAGVAAMAALLAYEHRTMSGFPLERLDPARIDRAFFRVNVGVSSAFFAFTLLDRLLPP